MINENHKPNPYKGTYCIIKHNNPEVIYKTQEVSSKHEFDTLLNEVIKYNNAHPEEDDKRILIQTKPNIN